MNFRRILHSAYIVTVFWGLAFWSCYRLLTPQDPDRYLSASSSYSISNALAHIDKIAAEPHPVGTQAHQKVARYLIEQIYDLGYQANVQETIVALPFSQTDRHPGEKALKVAWVKNIAVRIPGSDSQGAILIAAHYDTVHNSFGAADDGAAVASMLEVLRLIKSAAPQKNDLIFLFSDAEELGLMGSRAFVDQHPWAKDCRLALNFEARGTGGVLLMFETSEQNGGLIEHFKQSSYKPVASSLMYSIYKKLMPNDTDFTVFKDAGIAGLNFAFIEGGSNYHTRLDSVERLSPRTLALQGQNMLQMVRHFGGIDFNEMIEKPDLGFFNLPSGKLFSFPIYSKIPLLISGSLLTGFTLLVGIAGRRKYLRIRQCSLYTLVFIALSVLIVIFDYGLYTLIMTSRSSFRWLSEPYRSSEYYVVFCSLTIGLFTLFFLNSKRRYALLELWTGILFLWFAASVYIAIEFPAAVFFPALPVFSMLPVWCYWVFRSSADLIFGFLAGACSAFVLTIVTPTFYLAHHALGFHAIWMAMILLVLTLGLLIAPLLVFYRTFGWTMPAIFFAAALFFLILINCQPDFSTERPKPNSIVYAADIPSHTARWLSYDPVPDDWTQHFLGIKPDVNTEGIFSRFASGLTLLERQAKDFQLPPPDIRILERHKTNDRTLTKISIRSNRQAPFMRLDFEGIGDISELYIADRKVNQNTPASASFSSIDIYGLPENGTTLTLVMPAAAPFNRLEIIEVRPDLSEIWQPAYPLRPENTMPMRSSSIRPVDAVIVRQLYFF